MVKTIFFLAICALMVTTVGCAPDYPDDENHQNVSNSDCIACHVYREHDDAPQVPGGHLEGNDPDSRHQSCKDCHEQED